MRRARRIYRVYAALKHFADRLAEQLDAFLELFVGRCGEVDAERVAGLVLIGEERGARHDADLLFKRLLDERLHVDARRQVAPGEEAAVERVPGDVRREVLLHQVEQEGALLRVERAQAVEVRLVVVLGHKAVAEHLRPDIRVHVLALLADGHLGEHRLRADRVADAHARGDDLRERAGVEHDALLVEGLDRRQRLAGIAQVAVGVVLEDHHAVLLGEIVELFALLEAHRDAGGVLEIRDRVDELDVFLRPERLFERFHVHAVRIHRDADELRAVGAEVVQRADEARRFG